VLPKETRRKLYNLRLDLEAKKYFEAKRKGGNSGNASRTYNKNQ